MRMIQAIGIHLLVLALALTALFLMTKDMMVLNPIFLAGQVTLAAMSDALGQLRNKLFAIAIGAHGFSIALALLFLWNTDRANPLSDNQVRAYTPQWAGLLILALAGVAVSAWIVLWRALLPLALQGVETIPTGLALIFVAVFLAFYFGTALTVRPTMKLAVPLASLLRSLGRRG